MKDLEILISLGGTIAGLTLTVITFIFKATKNARAKKRAEQVIRMSDAVMPLIREAERFTSYSGEEKKAYVMTRACQFALMNRIRFDEKFMSAKVEELVALTKQINFQSAPTTKVEVTNDAEVAFEKKSWL